MIRSLLLKSIRMLNYFTGEGVCGNNHLRAVLSLECVSAVCRDSCVSAACTMSVAGWGREALVLTGDVSYMFCV